MSQLRTSCKCKFWLNKTTACFEFTSCVTRVIALDKETSSKAETVRDDNQAEGGGKKAQKTTEPPQSQEFKCCLAGLLAKKQVNSYAKHLSSVLSWLFKCWTHPEITPFQKFWKVSRFLFFAVCWGRGLFGLISESKENRNLSQNNLYQICEFTYQTIFLKAETSCLGMFLIRLWTCLGLKTTFSPPKHNLPVSSASSEPAQPNKEALKETFTEHQLY